MATIPAAIKPPISHQLIPSGGASGEGADPSVGLGAGAAGDSIVTITVAVTGGSRPFLSTQRTIQVTAGQRQY